MGRMFDDDRVGQAPLLHPLLQYECDAATVGENRNQGDIVALGHVRQVERQPRAHHDGISTVLAGDPHIVRVCIDRFHHVDGQHAAPFAQGAGRVNLACQRGEIGAFERRTIRIRPAQIDQIGVMMAQVNAGDRAKCALTRDAASQPVRRNANAHAALNDRQQRVAADDQRCKGMR